MGTMDRGLLTFDAFSTRLRWAGVAFGAAFAPILLASADRQVVVATSRVPVRRARPRRRLCRERPAGSGSTTRGTTMRAAFVSGRQSPQFHEFEAQRLQVRDVAVQRGTVGHRTHQQGVLAGCNASEWLECRGQDGRDPARDPESVVSVHVGLLASSLMVRASG
jgi:hypothetical protein